MQPLTLTIEGMSCANCARHVRQALTSHPGVAVREVHVGSAVVDYDPALTTPEAVAEAVTNGGYPAVPHSA